MAIPPAAAALTRSPAVDPQRPAASRQSPTANPQSRAAQCRNQRLPPAQVDYRGADHLQRPHPSSSPQRSTLLQRERRLRVLHSCIPPPDWQSDFECRLETSLPAERLQRPRQRSRSLRCQPGGPEFRAHGRCAPSARPRCTGSLRKPAATCGQDHLKSHSQEAFAGSCLRFTRAC